MEYEFFVLLMIWFFIRMYYSTKAGTHRHKELIRPGLESFLVALNFIGMMFLPLIAIFTPYLDQFSFDVPDYVRFIFLLIGFINVCFFARIHADLGKNWSMGLAVKNEHTLVKTGIYQYIRHPMYLHFWLWVIGQGIILANWVVLVYGVMAWGLLYVIRVPKEEEMLAGLFGDEYLKYMETTGRVTPKIGKTRF